MRLVRPYTITPGNLTSNVALDDAPEYSASATYAVGDVVMSTTGTAPTYRKYESLAAGNVGNALDDASKWLDLGPVNRWAMFDTKNGTATNSASNISVSVAIDGRVDGLALFGLDAERVYAQLTYTGNQHSNLLTYSEDFSNAAWLKTGVTVTANAALAPNGEVTADRIVTASGGGAVMSASASQNISWATIGTRTLSVYVKYDGLQYAAIGVHSGGGFSATASFDLLNGTVAATGAHPSYATIDSATIEDAGNGWFRCFVTVTGISADGKRPYVSGSSDFGGLYNRGVTGDGANGVLAWGAQIEQGSVASSYIPTTTAAVTTTSHTPWRSLVNLQSDSGITSWYSYFTEAIAYNTEAVLTEIPLYANPTISVTISAADGVVSCGTMVVGQSRELGGAVYGAKGGIQDYSRKETDDFGNYTLVERSYAKRNTFRVVCENNNVDAIFNLLAEVRATPVVWLGTDDYALTWSYGWARDWAVEIAYPTKSFLTIEIEGLT